MTGLTPTSAVLFDLDGTLLDTADDMGKVLNIMLSEDSLSPVSKSVYAHVGSDGALGMLRVGYPHLSAQQHLAMKERFLSLYADNIFEHTRLYVGIDSLLQSFVDHQVPWGIVTNKPFDLTERLLRHFPILQESLVTIGGDSLVNRKPHPQPLLHAANALDVSPSCCWYVGDAQRDMEAAQRAKMFSVLANWGYIHPDEQTHEWQPDLICQNAQQLQQAIFNRHNI